MTRTYRFEVRELTTREASVEARSQSEARTLLRRWAQGEGDLSDEGGPISLGDLETVRVTSQALSGRD
jgi:hypothetical protein